MSSRDRFRYTVKLCTCWAWLTFCFIGGTILLDVEAVIRQSTPSFAEAASPEKASFIDLDHTIAVLSTLLTFGLNKEIDGICRDKLHVDRSSAAVGLSA